MPNTPGNNQFSFTPAGQAPQLSIDQAMTLAAQLQSQGRLQESEYLLQQILQQAPNHPFALHLLGVIAHQVGKQALAAELIQRAIAFSPTTTLPRGERGQPPLREPSFNPALFHANLSEILRQLKRLWFLQAPSLITQGTFLFGRKGTLLLGANTELIAYLSL